MALCSALLGLGQEQHILGPLANCHWAELRHEPRDHSGRFWRLRAHNVGAPGPVIPFAVTAAEDDDAPDAEA